MRERIDPNGIDAKSTSNLKVGRPLVTDLNFETSVEV